MSLPDVGDQISHPYETTGHIISLRILIHSNLNNLEIQRVVFLYHQQSEDILKLSLYGVNRNTHSSFSSLFSIITTHSS